MFLERSVKKLIPLSFLFPSFPTGRRNLRLLSFSIPSTAISPKMISILAQERLLGASLGAVFTGGIVFYQRRGIHRSLHGSDPTSYEPIKLTPGNVSSDLAHAWNKTVDLTLGQVVKFLSSRGW